MATLNMNDLHCNGTSSAYGVYTCNLTYDSITRSGGTVTINNLKLNMTRQSSKYSTNRIAYCCAIGDTSNYINWNTQIKKSGVASAESYSLSLGSPSYSTTGTSIYIGIWVASTGASSDWTNFQHKVEHAFYPACPGAAPVWSTGPSIASRTETSITINRGSASYSPTYYYKLSSWGSWSTFSGSTATITGLSPNTYYVINVKANANGFDTAASDQGATTYAYPHISAQPGAVTAGNNQSVALYNPLSRSVSVSMTCNGRTIGSGTTTGTSISFGTSISEAGIAVGSTGTSGTATYTSNYSGVTSTSSNTFYLSSDYCKPTWGVSANNLIKYKDCNDAIVRLTGNNQTLVQQYSQIGREISYTSYPATPRYSATISSYEVNVNGTGWTSVANTSMVNSNVVVGSSATSVSISVRAKDSRGFYSDSLTRTIYVTPYFKPRGVIEANRLGGYGEVVSLKIVPTWAIGTSNAGTGIYQYSSDNGSTWSDEKTISTYNSEITLPEPYNNDFNYTFRVKLTDSLGTTGDFLLSNIGAGTPILFIDSEQKGAGINCFPPGEGFYVNGNKILGEGGEYRYGQQFGLDEDFRQGNNGTNVYNNNSNGTVTHSRVTDATAPNLSNTVLRITVNGSVANTPSPGCGGFYWAHGSYAGGIWTYLITAKIPIGYEIDYAANAYGDGAHHEWLTSQEGTGEWKNYICRAFAGTTGSFDAIGFFFLKVLKSGATDADYKFSWDVARATFFANTSPSPVYPVGAIYMSTVNVSPAALFGGSWEYIYDRFLIGAGSGYGVTATGGETSHTLSVEEMPWHWHTVNDHSHWIEWDTWGNGNHNHTLGGNTSSVASGSSYARPRGASSNNWATSYDTSWPGDHAHHMAFSSGGSTPGTNAQGAGWGHNNMPPYYAVYMWRRTG